MLHIMNAFHMKLIMQQFINNQIKYYSNMFIDKMLS